MQETIQTSQISQISGIQQILIFLLSNPEVQKELQKLQNIVGTEKVIEDLANSLYRALKEFVEKLAVEKYKNGEITLGQLKKILGVSEWEIDDILRKYNVYRRYEL